MKKYYLCPTKKNCLGNIRKRDNTCGHAKPHLARGTCFTLNNDCPCVCKELTELEAFVYNL